MSDDPLLGRLPIIVGITGHRDLDLPKYDAVLRASFWADLFGNPDAVPLWHSRIILIGETAIAAALCNDCVERRGFREHAERYELMTDMYGRAPRPRRHRALARGNGARSSPKWATKR